jgi:putative tryptophan/tyrosine transport system substrate-binding protein
MRRREFITLAGSAVAAWPLAAPAQQPTMPLVGVLSPPLGESNRPLYATFVHALAEAGYVEGKNVAIEYSSSMSEAAGDLVRRNVSVIFASVPDAVVAARVTTTSIPIVALDLESDPLAKGYVKSLARPGGNLTGMFLDLPELSGKQVGLLKEIRDCDS